MKTLFIFNQVPVKVRPSFWPLPAAAWLLLTFLARWRRPYRSWGQNAWVGLWGLPVAFSADIGHALAHTVSAKWAGAPVDEIILAADMPRTLYDDNDVPPRVHQMRAVGGPVFSGAHLLLSLLWRQSTPPGSVKREIADLACLSHGFIFFGSLAPLPFVDGGVLLKWSLVERGQTPEVADTAVNKAGIAMGITLSFLALLFAAARLLRRYQPNL